MPQVLLMEFDKNDRQFKLLKSAVDLASITTKGDKIGLNIDDVGYIFEVYDVIYGENGGTELLVIRLSKSTNWKLSKFPDIVIESK